ncbi:MAG: N-acetyltransferase [Maricaulaceae bacterium]|nr:N-acetyltransferase [Maricaulaceae bacterium]
MTALSIRTVSSLSGVPAAAWDRLANPPGAEYDPFLSWNFLQALEETGCAAPESGWAPRHLIAENDAGRTAGVMPLYAKSHSYGEYVFDHAWAAAYERAGGCYYPKLLTAIPFTPVTGRRLLSADAAVRAALARAAVDLCERWGVSGWHVNFPDEPSRAALDGLGLLPRTDRQFVWENPGYQNFDEFLGALSARKRKAVRRERRAALDGVGILRLTGADIRPEHWDVFFACYQDTGARKWGAPYLNRDFFALIGERMADDILLLLARREGRFIAAALNFIGGGALYGRHWGRLADQPFLHFELCYHQAVDFAIERGLSRVEAGAQGEHKLARGYVPKTVHSAHYIADPGLRAALVDYLPREREAVAEEVKVLRDYAPFRKLGQ